MTKEEKADFRGAGRVAFLAREKEIKEMIDAGHPKKNVYRKYGALLNISYGQFARYVNKFIRNSPNDSKLQEEKKDGKTTGTTDSRSGFKPSKKRNDLY